MNIDNNNNNYNPILTFLAFFNRNIVLFLTIISFFVIGYDLTTEIAEQNNEVGFYTAILNNSTNTVKPLKIPSIKKTDTPLTTLNFHENTNLNCSEHSETFQSRPPPEA